MLRILCVAVAAGLGGTICSAGDTEAATKLQYQRAIKETDKFLQAVTDQGAFGGTVSIIKDGVSVFDGAYGDASMELGVPLRPEHRFPIGSNSKLFTALSIYQLAYNDSVDLSLHDNIAQYFDKSVFDLDEDYCPKLLNATDDDPCEVITIDDLLMMQSGLLQVIEDAVPGLTPEWAYAYDMSQQSSLLGAWDNLSTGVDLNNGQPTAFQTEAGMIKLSNILKAPLMNKPGQADPTNAMNNMIAYNNMNFIILGHIVEVTSGLSLREYVATHLTEPLGLDIEYDPTQGNDLSIGGIRKNSLAGYFSYNRYLSIDEGGQSQPTGENFEWSTSSAKWRVVGNTLSVASGAGGFIGSAHDLALWYLTIMDAPEKIGLTDEIVREILTPTGYNYFGIEWEWAHSIFVGNPDAPLFSMPNGPDQFYCGGIANFMTWVLGWNHDTDKDGGDVLAVFKNTAMGTTFDPSTKLDMSCSNETAYGYPCECTITATGEPLGAPDLCNILNTAPLGDSEYIVRKLQEIWDLGS